MSINPTTTWSDDGVKSRANGNGSGGLAVIGVSVSGAGMATFSSTDSVSSS